jgi:hypothetical protein
MTEEQWLAGADPKPMLEYLRGKVSDRKLRLFAAAGYRLCYGPDLTYSATAQRAVEVAERFADGLAGREELSQSSRAASDAVWYSLDAVFGHTRASEVEGAAAQVAGEPAGAAQAIPVARYNPNYGELTAAQAGLLRDIVGGPFRPVTTSPAWRTAQVMALARVAYDQRELPSGTLDVARLGVLADALEEAGCDQADLLGHLRGPGPHVRGCWALDLLLGKE